MRLVIHAPNVHVGGGRSLLLALLAAVSRPVIVQIDNRLTSLPDLPAGSKVIRVKASIRDRLAAESRLSTLCSQHDDILLCFGNLPPLFCTRLKTYVFLQNRYLSSARSLSAFPIASKIRLWLERLWLRSFKRDAQIIVQTESMKVEVDAYLSTSSLVLPFFYALKGHGAPLKNKQFDYLYVASGDPHKNHERLLEAWSILAQKKFYPSLCITLDPISNKSLVDRIELLKYEHGINIVNQPAQFDQISDLYKSSRCLIYPSLFESFGLPLLEAQEFGLDIIATESDYVRDVVDPQETFDPKSSLSIARAVLRHNKYATDRPAPLEAEGFLEFLLNS